MSEESSSLPRATVPDRNWQKYPPLGSSRRGKVWLVLIFFALRGMDAYMYFGNPFGISSQLAGAILSAMVWTTALLAGIWFRQSWCRHVLPIFLLLGSIGVMIVYSSVNSPVTIESMIVFFAGFGLGNTAIAWALITSPDIKRLTNRHLE